MGKYMEQHLRFRTRLLIRIFLASTMVALATHYASAADLTIHVINENNSSGVAFISVQPASEANSFPRGKAIYNKKMAMIPHSKAKFTIKDIPSGAYAVSAFLDINNNQKLDMNLIGAPTEPYGFSNDARGLFGPPEFTDAAFIIKKDTMRNRHTIKIY